MPKTNRLIEGLDPNASPFLKEESEKMAAKFDTDTTVSESGIVRWKSNHNVPPADILVFWKHIGKPFDYEMSRKANFEDTQAILASYRRENQNRQYSGEELHEMRNAFGVGETVVDLITGKRTKL